jgi:acyl dehydratase
VRVEVGDEIPPFRMERVTPERMKTVAAIFRDPFPVHWDREATRAMGFEGRLLNQSPVNLGYVINMLMAWAGPTCLRRVRAEFPQPVLDGDSVCAGGRIVAISREGEERVAECEAWLERQDGVRSVAARAWVTLPRDPD